MRPISFSSGVGSSLADESFLTIALCFANRCTFYPTASAAAGSLGAISRCPYGVSKPTASPSPSSYVQEAKAVPSAPS